MSVKYTGIRSKYSVLLAIYVLLCPFSPAVADGWEETPHGWDQLVEGSGNSDIKTIGKETWGYTFIPGTLPAVPQTNNRDDTIRQSNTRTPTAEADHYVDWAHCAADSQDPDVPDYLRVAICAYPPPEHGEEANPQRVPTTREILLAAATIIHADGAGLHKRPSKVSFTNKYIPTIVAATHPTQTHTINLLGHDITITLTATNYEWDWGDGTPNTVTAYHGMPYEKGMDLNKDPRLIRHYYTPPNGWRSRFDGPYPDATRTITLTTTWSGTATNPFTGETQTINGLVTTTETTGPFPLDHLTVSNTDTWEEKQGH